MSEKHNGWTNYETWAAHLHMFQEQCSHETWLAEACFAYAEARTNAYFCRLDIAVLALADQMKDHFEALLPDDLAGVFQDLLTAAFSEINWHEIAEVYILLAHDKKELAS